MTRKTDHNRSQIVFDITSGEPEYRTMNLSTIPNRRPMEKKTGDFSLRTDDIEGARYVKPVIHVRNTNMDTSDIQGTSTRPMVDPRIPAKDLLNVDDIDGAKPRIIKQLPHSKRMINPTDPVYQLPSYKPEEPYVPKFIRDHMKNDDVEGASPKPLYTDKPAKDIMKVDDISGPRTSNIRNIKTHNRNLDVSDINNDGLFKTSRHTNPLVPDYTIGGQTLVNDFGVASPPIKGHNGPFYPLETSDISGCAADTTTKRFREFRQPPPPSPEDDLKPAEILMLPSMEKQTRDLERQREAARTRGDKIRFYENRNLHAEMTSSDPAQTILRRHREDRARAHQNFQTTLTFG